MAGCVRRATRQPRLRRPIRLPDHPRAQQAHRYPGPGGDRRSDPAAVARRRHHRPTLGSGHRPATAPHVRRRCLSPPDISRRPVKQGRGEPNAAVRNHGHLDAYHGQPRPSSHQPDYTLPGPTPLEEGQERHRPRQLLPGPGPGQRRGGRRQDQHIPRGTVPAHRPPPRAQESRRRDRPIPAGHRLAPTPSLCGRQVGTDSGLRRAKV